MQRRHRTVTAAHPSRVMPLGFQCLHPEGMAENSPRFQPWVNECETISSPGGTEEFVSKRSVAPSRAWSVRCTSIPPINQWAIFGRPCGTGTAHVASNPSNIGRDGCATEFSLRDILHSWNRFRRTGLIWSRGEAALRFSLRHRWSRPRFVKRQNIGLMPLPMLVTVKT